MIGKIIYVEEREILTYILIANKHIHSIFSLKKKMGMIIKLDIPYYFDRLKWKFIFHMLRVYCFAETWISSVLQTIKKAFLSILVNESPSPTFYPSHDLRRGYHLSPYLFLLMVVGLNREIKHVVSESLLRGILLYLG